MMNETFTVLSIVNLIPSWLPHLDIQGTVRLYSFSEMLDEEANRSPREHSREELEDASPFAQCSGSPHTVTVVTLANGTVFGGYISAPFAKYPEDANSSGDYEECIDEDEAFVFSAIPPPHRRGDAPVKLHLAWRNVTDKRERQQRYKDSCVRFKERVYCHQPAPYNSVEFLMIFDADETDFVCRLSWLPALFVDLRNPGHAQSVVNTTYVLPELLAKLEKEAEERSSRESKNVEVGSSSGSSAAVASIPVPLPFDEKDKSSWKATANHELADVTVAG